MALQVAAAFTVDLLLRRDDVDDVSSQQQPGCTDYPAGKNGAVPITNCNSYYNAEPKLAPAIAVAIIFGLLTVAHFTEAVIYRKRYTWVVIMGATWETVAFILHSLGSKDQQQIGYATGWSILFLLAPLWVNAFVYMTFARMAYFFLSDTNRKIWGMNTTSIAKWFVFADIVAFLIQGIGCIMATPGASPDFVKTGLKVCLAGMGLQQFFIVLFLGLMVQFHRLCMSWGPDGTAEYADKKGRWKPLQLALYAVLTAITIRLIYRIAEFAKGVDPATNPIPFHAGYFYALDCVPMMMAILVLAIWYPGRFLTGPVSGFPSGKQRRADGRARKAAKKAAQQDKKDRKTGVNKELAGQISNRESLFSSLDKGRWSS